MPMRAANHATAHATSCVSLNIHFCSLVELITGERGEGSHKPILEAARPVAQITTLLVGEEERRWGIGRLLVKAAAQAARSAGCGELEILTTSTAPSLHEFCRTTGFAQAGARFVRSLRKQG